MLDGEFCMENLWYLLLVFVAATAVCGILLRKKE